MRKFLLIAILALTMGLTGCATIFSDSEYPVSIDSSPSLLVAEISDGQGNTVHREQTPFTVTLDAGDGFFQKQEYTIKLFESGNVVGEIEIDNSLDPWFFANIAGSNIVGMLVDGATGAMWSLESDVVVYLDDIEEWSSKQTETSTE